MAGYSGTPLVKKLGIKPGHTVVLHRAPRGFTLDVDDDVRLVKGLRGKGPWDVVLSFVTTAAALAASFSRVRPRLDEAGGLWIVWPKKASGVATEVAEADVRRAGLATGLVDNKICAVDETWSGLRFVVRRADRS